VHAGARGGDGGGRVGRVAESRRVSSTQGEISARDGEDFIGRVRWGHSEERGGVVCASRGGTEDGVLGDERGMEDADGDLRRRARAQNLRTVGMGPGERAREERFAEEEDAGGHESGARVVVTERGVDRDKSVARRIRAVDVHAVAPQVRRVSARRRWVVSVGV